MYHMSREKVRPLTTATRIPSIFTLFALMADQGKDSSATDSHPATSVSRGMSPQHATLFPMPRMSLAHPHQSRAQHPAQAVVALATGKGLFRT